MIRNRPKGLKRCAMCGKVWFGNTIYVVKTNTRTKVCERCNDMIEHIMETKGKLVVKRRK